MAESKSNKRAFQLHFKDALRTVQAELVRHVERQYGMQVTAIPLNDSVQFVDRTRQDDGDFRDIFELSDKTGKLTIQDKALDKDAFVTEFKERIERYMKQGEKYQKMLTTEAATKAVIRQEVRRALASRKRGRLNEESWFSGEMKRRQANPPDETQARNMLQDPRFKEAIDYINTEVTTWLKDLDIDAKPYPQQRSIWWYDVTDGHRMPYSEDKEVVMSLSNDGTFTLTSMTAAKAPDAKRHIAKVKQLLAKPAATNGPSAPGASFGKRGITTQESTGLRKSRVRQLVQETVKSTVAEYHKKKR
jgi:hypothetical protein